MFKLSIISLYSFEVWRI